MRYLFALLLLSCATEAPIAEVCPYQSPEVCTVDQSVCHSIVALCGCRVPYELKACLECRPWGVAPRVPVSGGSCFAWPE
jgi:hypothetical protein